MIKEQRENRYEVQNEVGSSAVPIAESKLIE